MFMGLGDIGQLFEDLRVRLLVVLMHLRKELYALSQGFDTLVDCHFYPSAYTGSWLDPIKYLSMW